LELGAGAGFLIKRTSTCSRGRLSSRHPQYLERQLLGYTGKFVFEEEFCQSSGALLSRDESVDEAAYSATENVV
jgi:hypothetical protein